MAAQVQHGCDDHSSGGSATPHLAVEDEGSALWRLPQPPHQQCKILLFRRLFVGDWDTCVIHLVTIVCAAADWLNIVSYSRCIAEVHAKYQTQVGMPTVQGDAQVNYLQTTVEVTETQQTQRGSEA